jgi:hypothetical protein
MSTQSTRNKNQIHGRHKRPFLTQYFTDSDASGKKPASMGYAASVRGARKNMAVRIVLGQYGLAIVAERDGGEVLSVMRRTKAGLNIKDTQPIAESLTMLEEGTK